MNDSSYVCPVCGLPGLSERPYMNFPEAGTVNHRIPYQESYGPATFEICPCCGYEFGYDDHPGATAEASSFLAWRERWIAGGCRWWSTLAPQPVGWDVQQQLDELKKRYP